MLVRFDQVPKQLAELPQFFGTQGGDDAGRAEKDCIGRRDGVVAGGRERDQFATSVLGMGLAFDQTMGLELVNNDRRVRFVDAVRLGKLSQRHGPVAQLEKDFASPGTEAEPERLGQVVVAVVRVDELMHESPHLLGRTSGPFAARRTLSSRRAHHGTAFPR